MTDLGELLADRSVTTIICCGSGGVGKTSTSAALAVYAAELGRDVVVLTIDPARRLAQALGIDELGNEPTPVPGVGAEAGGSLEAMMLDMKRTFDEVVTAHANPQRAQQILENPFYQALSSSFAGTNEYMAMEKLGQLRGGRSARGTAWDLIVVDTPPSRSALDFLDAPQRLSSFLDGRFLRILTAPARTGGRAYVRTMTSMVSGVTGAMNRVLGSQVLTDVQNFVAALDTMFGGFRQRAEQTYAHLKTPGTTFVVVASPTTDALREADYFVRRLRADDMQLAGVVVNRVIDSAAGHISAQQAAEAADRVQAQHPLASAVLRSHAARMLHRDAQQEAVQGFTATHRGLQLHLVPALDEDIHDLDGLRTLAAAAVR
ncbi:MAG: ATPase [Micrococcales bacterium]|nr:MAG: ATPase [Micrococcales bacterium]PIE27726.1 MAG: ATPase [Micrococcales bacterium]